jgi:hypothetical protein
MKTQYSETIIFLFNLPSFSFKITTGLHVLPLQSSYSYVTCAHYSSLKMEAAHLYPPEYTASRKTSALYIKILNLCGTQVSIPLSYISNKSISVGIFPDRLKYTDVKTLLKKGDVIFYQLKTKCSTNIIF